MKLYKTLLFIGLAAVLVFSPIARGAVRTWSITPVLLVLYALIFMWMLRVVNKNGDSPHLVGTTGRGQSPFLDPLTAPIALFAILATSSFAFSVYKHDSFYALIRLFAYIGLYYLVVNETGHRMRKSLIWLAISVGGCLSAYGLLQYFGILKHPWWVPQQFLAATYVNHNHFAGYLELVMPAGAALFVLKPARYRFILASALVLMASAFILTQSRGAWISLGFSLLIMAVLMAKKASGNARMIAVAALLVIAVAALLYLSKDIVASRMDTITDLREGEDMSGGRFAIWQGAAGMIRERPLLGFGIGDFDAGFYRYRPAGFNARAVFAHNDYLQAAAEMGVFAPLVMLWIFIIAIRKGFMQRASSPYAFGCAIGVLSLALHGLVDFNFHIPANMILFVIWIGIVMGESRAERT